MNQLPPNENSLRGGQTLDQQRENILYSLWDTDNPALKKAMNDVLEPYLKTEYYPLAKQLAKQIVNEKIYKSNNNNMESNDTIYKALEEFTEESSILSIEAPSSSHEQHSQYNRISEESYLSQDIAVKRELIKKIIQRKYESHL